MDGNGDGCGDFEGLTRRLNYLESLGNDAIGIGPFQASPSRDNGYDIADFYFADKRFGSDGDYVEFMNHAKSRGIHVLIDLSLTNLRPARMVQAVAERRVVATARLVCRVKGAPEELETGHGLSRRAEDHVDARSGGEGVLLRPILRFAARSMSTRTTSWMPTIVRS